MVEEEFTLVEVLGVSKDEPPRKEWLDYIPMVIRRFLRNHIGWPRLSLTERWGILCLIQEEFNKQLEKEMIRKEHEKPTVIYNHTPEYWN